MKNKHMFTTIKEIIEVVNKKNIKFFLKDFSNWLELNVKLKEEEIEIKKMGGTINFPQEFIWIDDGKNNIEVTMKFAGQNETEESS